MTIKQLIVGTLIGASALGSALERMPKQPTLPDAKPAIKRIVQGKHKVKVASRHTQRKHAVETPQLSLNKVFE